MHKKSVDISPHKKKKKKNAGTTDQIVPGGDAQTRALETGRNLLAIVTENESMRERVRG